MVSPRPLLLVLAAAAVLCLAGIGYRRYQQHRAARAIERPAQAHADSLALQAGRQADFDRRFYVATGRAAEAQRRATISRKSYDSTRHLFSGVLPALPEQPPRYRPGQ